MYKSEICGKGGIYAKVVADSISSDGVRLCTLELNYPRFIHSEFMTHRVFSRNASSSRAIPIEKMLDNVKEHPAYPIYWGMNKSGMQAKEEIDNINHALGQWSLASIRSAEEAEKLKELGLHKQIVNRITEPFQFIRVIVTATEWDNFFSQRLHPDAQPEIQELAKCIKSAIDTSIPIENIGNTWHLPYTTNEDWDYIYSNLKHDEKVMEALKKVSVARCARVSYLNHDGERSIEKDVKLCDFLLDHGHFSPFEHVAKPMERAYSNGTKWWKTKWNKGITHEDRMGMLWSGNFKGWVQYRQEIGA